MKHTRIQTVPVVLLGLMLFVTPAFAKRTPAPVVEPLVHKGIKYVVPNDKGTLGYVEAWDVTKGKKLWTKTIFRKHLIPLVEHDVQWVFIKKMWLKEERLFFLVEDRKTYSLDLKTRRVRRTPEAENGS